MPPTNEPVKKWKAPKGPKPVHHKNKNTIGLGRSIANSRKNENKIEYLPDGEMRFTTDKHQPNWVKLRSVTQENALDEFLNTAELADTDFTSERNNAVRIIKVDPTKNNPYLLSKVEEIRIGELQKQNMYKLTVPRRPKWDISMTRTQLERQEKESFLDWRRGLAYLQENNDLLLTPFERNIEVWRQLWRVVERSDLVVQIVDARNPLAFRSPDLEVYVKQLDSRKRNLLLVNKADMLTASQRTAWSRYFIENDIRYVFFSASQANELLSQENEDDDDDDNVSIKSTDAYYVKPAEIIDEPKEIRILKIDELEELFLKEAPEPLTISKNPNEPSKLQIGLVGYPNVGKSSTINALVGSKKVSVSATPGKTKHFQTIHLSPQVLLCDCPGLVFPNFAYSNGELVCNGVLPIDQLREYTGPCQLVTQRIPKFFLEAVYGIAIPTKSIDEGGSGIPTSQELLNAYARARGYMTQGFGSADESRASRYILKDYVSGKLLYVQPPPNEDGSPISEIQSQEFNKELYTFSQLSESRQNQLIQAAQSKNINAEEIDLEHHLSKLNFSSHLASTGDEAAKSVTHGGKQAALINVGDELDKEFFKKDLVKGNFTTPFYRVETGDNGKKHGKKGKKYSNKKTVGDY